MSEKSNTSTKMEAGQLDERTQESQVYLDSEFVEKPFTIWTAMGLGHSITNTAVGMIVGLGNGLPFGGPPVIFWGFLTMACVGLCIAISLGELSSAFPHSGGQYYWVGTMAPPSMRRFCSYMTGILSFASALCVTASINIVVTQQVIAMITLANPDFPNHPWIVFVGYQLANLLAAGFNFFGKSLSWVSKALLIYTPCIVFTVFVACLAGRHEKQPADAIFLEVTSVSGWPTGLAFIIGFNPSAWSFSCLDAATHLADEIPQPQKNIPKALLCTVALGFVTGLPIILSLLFSAVDLDALSSVTAPSLEIFRQVYQSDKVAIILSSLVVLSAWGATIGSQTWQSRIAWAFAKDKGFPFHSRLGSVAGKPFLAPIWAHVWSSILCAILGCLYLASDLAFNSLVAGGILFQYITYSASICCLLYVGRSNITPGPFWFPRLGLIANLVVLAWSLVSVVLFCFPYQFPVLAGSMNYVSVVIAVVVLYAVVYWFLGGRKVFTITESRLD
ncbi:unnamed protein product [Clonostachys rosea]|uniref:Amino acid permease/ SLC12A domain-containing protein n=1 Tax=Bionectria ochroleuca TaxID=29856 RepID=A0ABY6TUX6_BIOOC|nr:unnamed protein product [Clonostachys rosea]